MAKRSPETPAEAKERKEALVPVLDIPSFQELREGQIESLHHRWMDNHRKLLAYVKKNRRDIPPFGLHGAAKKDLADLLASKKGVIRVATYDFPSRPSQLIGALYGICHYGLSYASRSKRASEQGLGGVVFIKRFQKDGKPVYGSQSRLNTETGFHPLTRDPESIKRMSDYIRQQYDDEDILDSDAILDALIPFPRQDARDPEMYFPKIFYRAEQIQPFLEVAAGTGRDVIVRSILSHRFMVQDMLQIVLKELQK